MSKIQIQIFEEITPYTLGDLVKLAYKHAGHIKTIGDRSYWVWVK